MQLNPLDIHNHLLPEGVKTSLAAEYMICADFENDIAKRAGGLLCYEDRSILVEMSFLFGSPNLDKSLFELQMAGFKPILAHPERYLYMADRLEDFDRLTGGLHLTKVAKVHNFS